MVGLPPISACRGVQPCHPPALPWGWELAQHQRSGLSFLPPFVSQHLAMAPLGLSSHPPARLHFSGFELILSTPLSAGCQLSIPWPPPASCCGEMLAAAAGGTDSSKESLSSVCSHCPWYGSCCVNRSIGSSSIRNWSVGRSRAGPRQSSQSQISIKERAAMPQSPMVWAGTEWHREKPEQASLLLGTEPIGRNPRWDLHLWRDFSHRDAALPHPSVSFALVTHSPAALHQPWPAAPHA